MEGARKKRYKRPFLGQTKKNKSRIGNIKRNKKGNNEIDMQYDGSSSEMQSEMSNIPEIYDNFYTDYECLEDVNIFESTTGMNSEFLDDEGNLELCESTYLLKPQDDECNLQNLSSIDESENKSDFYEEVEDFFLNDLDECDMPSLYDIHELNEKKVEPNFELIGKRIVDLNYLFTQIKNMNSHSALCNFNDMHLMSGIGEFKKGFNSHLRFSCKKCGYIAVLKTCKQTEEEFDLNYATVLASMSIGIGFSQLEELTAILSIPCLSSTAYVTTAKQVVIDLKEAAKASMKTAAEEEIKLAVEHGNVDENGTPLITCLADTAWSKRSYGTNYSAPAGTATIVGFNTHKVIWNGVANKFCSICKRITSKQLSPYEHDCNCNYIGPSTGMEPKLTVEGFKYCQETHGLRISHLVGDGDSSVIAAINKANLYRDPNLVVEKIECDNHLFRNTRGSLLKLSSSRKLKPYLTPGKIEEIIKDIRCARTYWQGRDDLSIEAKTSNLRHDIYNTPFHVFGSHQNCAAYFCTKKDKVEENMVQLMVKDNSFNDILQALSRIRYNAKSLLINETTNIVEQFNALIAKYIGGKRIDFTKGTSYDGRVQLAVLQHNTGRAYSAFCEYMCKNASAAIKKVEFNRLVRNMLHQNRETLFKPKTAKCQDKHYGTDTCEKPDMTDEVFNFEKDRFLDKLAVNQLNRVEIEKNTRSQAENSEWKKSEWKNYRFNMLTASNFGRVCRARSAASFTGIVDSILYKDISHLKQIAHGSFYEKNAIRKLEEHEGIKVEKCGLFIDEKYSFLGASPDGTVGNDFIVEVKCPLSVFDKDIDQAILAGKLNVWSKQRKPRKKNVEFVPKILGINKNQYYQVQGQLHIAKKKLCYFVVWAGDHLPIRVEKIERDDLFWQTKLEPKLVEFYHTALLPELVDPRAARGMDLRKYDAAGVCIA